MKSRIGSSDTSCQPLTAIILSLASAPRMIFSAADEKGIKLPVTSLDIIDQLQRRSPRPFKTRALEMDAEIYVTEEGEVLLADKKL